MIETHPFGIFVPVNAKYIILGSFSGRQAVRGTKATDEAYDWFYGTKRNQFWPILEEVYGIELRNKNEKQALFNKLGMAIADIIYQCERKAGNNLDANLIVIAYNKEIETVFTNNQIGKILFTSRFVENRFRQVFNDIITRYPACELTTLPSPSPRYVLMNKAEKINKYIELFPKL